MQIGSKNIKIKNIIMVLFASIIFLCSGSKVQATPTQIDGCQLILIDPGHGGIDGGAVSRNGIIEKNINLIISLKLRDKLKDLGYQVVLTREEDKGFYTRRADVNIMKAEDLNNRCRMKRDSNCDLFISIHQNFFRDRSSSGAQVWYSRNIESKEFAHILQQNLRKDLGKNKREEKEAGSAYKILRCYTSIPSVIVECGFLTNAEEEIKLTTSEYQDKIADTITKSIKEYFDSNTNT